jgi:hypothetical protein
MSLNTHQIIFSIVFIYIVTFAPSFLLPPNVQSSLNYLNVLLLVIYVIARSGGLLVSPFLNSIFIMSLVTLTLGETVNKISIYLPLFITFGIVTYDYVMKYGVDKVNVLVHSFIFLGMFQMAVVYFQMGNIPNFDSYYGGWLYTGGFSLGITKGGLGFFGVISLLWFLARKKYLGVLLCLALFYPVFLSSRLIGVVGALIVCLHLFLTNIKLGSNSNKGAFAFFGVWCVIFTGIFYSIYIADNFDRLPSYAVGYDVMLETGNLFGLGFRNYQYYIIDNFDRLNITYSSLMPVNMTEFYTSGESIYADSFASYGVLGVFICIIYNVILLANLRIYFKLTNVEKWFVLVWALFVFGGVAQDFTSTNGIFYIIFGVNVALLKKYGSTPIKKCGPTPAKKLDEKCFSV